MSRAHPMSLALVTAALLGPAAALAQDAWVLEAGHVVVRADTEPLVGAKVLVVGGEIKAVGADVTAPAGARVVKRPESWVIPALVDASTALGLIGERDDVADPIQPDVSVAWRLNPKHSDFAAAREAGVGTCLVAPGDANLYGGEGLVLRTDGQARRAEAIGKLALGAGVLRNDRPPTSRIGAIGFLREAIEARQGDGAAADGFGRFATGVTRGLFSVSETRDLRAVLGLLEPYGLRVVFQLSPSFEPKDVEGLQLAGLSFVIGPYGAGSSPRSLKLAAALGKQPDVTLAFRSAAPFTPAGGLRLQAALAVAHGLSPQRALHALTQGGAEVLGVGERVGTLEPGKQADLLLLSGPPLDVSSRVLELYLGGERAYTRPAAPGEER